MNKTLQIWSYLTKYPSGTSGSRHSNFIVKALIYLVLLSIYISFCCLLQLHSGRCVCWLGNITTSSPRLTYSSRLMIQETIHILNVRKVSSWPCWRQMTALHEALCEGNLGPLASLGHIPLCVWYDQSEWQASQKIERKQVVPQRRNACQNFTTNIHYYNMLWLLMSLRDLVSMFLGSMHYPSIKSMALVAFRPYCGEKWIDRLQDHRHLEPFEL